jgi:hypothetical protein
MWASVERKLMAMVLFVGLRGGTSQEHCEALWVWVFLFLH